MVKKWAERGTEALIEAWLRTIKTQIDVYECFDRAFFVFYENLDAATVEAVADILGIDNPYIDGFLDKRYAASALEPEAIPAELEGVRQVCTECEEIYRDLKDSFSRETLRYVGKENQHRLFARTNQRLAGLLKKMLPEAKPLHHFLEPQYTSKPAPG
jgi:hypothetical protein